MKRKKLIGKILASSLMLIFAAKSSALEMDIEGASASGLNDSTDTAQDLGTVSDGNPLTVFGYIDSNNQNDVDFFKFSVAGSTLGLFFDIDFADDYTQTGDGVEGLDSYLWVFDATGTLIAENDDSEFFERGPINNAGTDPGSDPYGNLDSFIGELLLDPGTYFAAVVYRQNSPSAEGGPGYTTTNLSLSGYLITGATADATFLNDVNCDLTSETECVGQYQLQIRTTFADQDVPEPATLALWLIGLAGIGSMRKRMNA